MGKGIAVQSNGAAARNDLALAALTRKVKATRQESVADNENLSPLTGSQWDAINRTAGKDVQRLHERRSRQQLPVWQRYTTPFSDGYSPRDLFDAAYAAFKVNEGDDTSVAMLRAAMKELDAATKTAPKEIDGELHSKLTVAADKLQAGRVACQERYRAYLDKAREREASTDTVGFYATALNVAENAPDAATLEMIEEYVRRFRASDNTHRDRCGMVSLLKLANTVARPAISQ